MKNKKGFHHTIKRLNLALLSNEECILVDVWYSKQLGHQVVAEMPRSHLHSLPSLAQLLNVLNHISKAKSEILHEFRQNGRCKGFPQTTHRGENDLKLSIPETLDGKKEWIGYANR